MKRFREYLLMFIVGLVAYPIVEILWRGYTHWTMILTGGVCVLTVYFIFVKFKTSTVWEKCIIGATVITSIEFIVGCIVNLYLKWNVWDYSKLPGNVLGQICPRYFLFWAGLCLPIVYLSNYIHESLSFHMQ